MTRRTARPRRADGLVGVGCAQSRGGAMRLCKGQRGRDRWLDSRRRGFSGGGVTGWMRCSDKKRNQDTCGHVDVVAVFSVSGSSALCFALWWGTQLSGDQGRRLD